MLLSFKTHQYVKTVCTVYAGLQKDQSTKLTKLPELMIGQIRGIHTKRIDGFDAITYYLVRFTVARSGNGGKNKPYHYWAKVSESCLISIDS